MSHFLLELSTNKKIKMHLSKHAYIINRFQKSSILHTIEKCNLKQIKLPNNNFSDINKKKIKAKQRRQKMNK